MPTRRLTISGEVQGVFYRNWTLVTARGLGLTGFVRNLGSGQVEIVATGPDDRIAALVEQCRKGPPAAKVETIDEEVLEQQDFATFEKRATA